MKKLLFILVFGSSFFSLNAQSWQPLGSGINGQISALTLYNGNLIASGAFDSAGGHLAYNVAQWDGTKWDSLGSGVVGSFALCTYGSNLIASGGYSSGVSQWNGTTWSSLGGGISFRDVFGGGIFALDTFKGKLIVGGLFDTNSIEAWNGTTWSGLGLGIHSYGKVSALTVYNGNLIAAGYFLNAGGVAVNHIALWNGTSWSALGAGINGYAACLTVYNGNLYACGSFDSVGGIKANNIAMWDGTTWHSLDIGTNGYVFALTVFNGNLIVGGSFDSAGGHKVNNLAQWNGTSWSAITPGISSTPFYGVYALAVYKNNLYAGGGFSIAGGAPANGIMEYCPLCPDGINTIATESYDVKVYPNPSSGVFTLSIYNPQLGIRNHLEVYNTLGQQVYSKELSTLNSPLSIDLSSNPTGMYFYRIQNENGDFVSEGKVVIER